MTDQRFRRPDIQGDPTYDTDLILVLDGTSSMRGLTDLLAERIRALRDSVQTALEKGSPGSARRHLGRLRVRVVVFRDVYVDAEPFARSEWYRLPEEESGLSAFLEGVRAKGGGDEPESGLEALRLAMDSFEAMEGRGRQIILLMTDASAHPLDDPRRASYPVYPGWMSDCRSLADLEQLWEDMDRRRSRMLIVAPNAYPWSDLQAWSRVWYLPCPAGAGIDSELLDGLFDALPT
ncbi:MAG: hypothetical protein IJH78_04050 [Clostridia bacterium]|nr:hypothetical protein [Clostridia bacterium]